MRRLLLPATLTALALAAFIGAPKLESADQASSAKAYVTNSLGNDITVIDLKTMQVTDDIVVGEKPHGVCAPADGRRVFTTIESEKNLKIIDTATDKITAIIPLTGRPNQCGVTPDGKFVAVPIRDSNSFDIVDVAQKKVVKVLPAKLPHNCYNAGDNHQMFCTAMDEKAVHRIDLDTMTSVSQISLGGTPRPIAVTADEKTLFASLSDLHGFVIADVASGKVVRTIEFPPGPFAAVPLEPDTPTHGMQVTPDGKELWLAGIVDDAVFVYDIAEGRVTRKIPAGHAPNWLAFSPDGRYCVVSNAGSNNESIIDTATYREVARLDVGKGPKRVVVVAAP